MSHPKALFLLLYQEKLFKFHICFEADLPRKGKVKFLAVLLLFAMILQCNISSKNYTDIVLQQKKK